ncbi:MAG: DUF202 domain-containing protein [Proteobacteria bacterium]|nr:DUF202 domain-containing protein [Pseudomonadota bacterium]
MLFDETLAPSEALVASLDFALLTVLRWLPLKVEEGQAWVITSRDDRDTVASEVRVHLGVQAVDVARATDATLTRFIEHAQDLNPGFPIESSRTILARTRTYLADRRSQLASYRTLLVKGRTGLAMLRTGLALLAVSLVLVKIFGFTGLVLIPEGLLMFCGTAMVADGLIWYFPARRLTRGALRAPAAPGEPFTIPFATLKDDRIVIRRSPPVAGAQELARDHDRLSPVMRRRLMALERTELALERTRLAFFRTIMAKSRTGMALVRTGIALAGIGIAFQQRINNGSADILGTGLMVVGIVLIAEGLGWYLSGRKSGRLSQSESEKASEKSAGWDMLFPPAVAEGAEERYRFVPAIMAGSSPGIWGSTGLALERTLLAERRNVMARFRTSHARSRTGMAYLRTAANFVAVGLGLLLTGPARGIGWTGLECTIIAVGLLLFVDGLYWIIPARRERWQLSFCESQMEISVPDYLKPAGEWQVFTLEDGCE